MAASLMAKTQEKRDRIGLRMRTFLKRCGRDPETGQLLSLTGKRVDGEDDPIHNTAMKLYRARQHKRHLWTPKQPPAFLGTTTWHDSITDEDADVVRKEFEEFMDRTTDSTMRFYIPDPNTTSAEYREALDMTDVYLQSDTTHHVSQTHLRQDNKAHRVCVSQRIRGDGMDKVTSGVPPDQRVQVRPGRADIVLPGQTQDSPSKIVSRLVSHKQLRFLRSFFRHKK